MGIPNSRERSRLKYGFQHKWSWLNFMFLHFVYKNDLYIFYGYYYNEDIEQDNQESHWFTSRLKTVHLEEEINLIC